MEKSLNSYQVDSGNPEYIVSVLIISVHVERMCLMNTSFFVKGELNAKTNLFLFESIDIVD